MSQRNGTGRRERQNNAPPRDVLETGLPVSIDAERYVLGAILLDPRFYGQAAALLDADSWSQEAHRRIFSAMGDIQSQDGQIGAVPVIEWLERYGMRESVGGLSYLVSLSDGVSLTGSSIQTYVRIVREKADLRKIIFASQRTMNEALLGESSPAECLNSARESLDRIQTESRDHREPASAAKVVEDTPGGAAAYLDPSKRQHGISTGFAKFDEMTDGLHGGDVVILAARPGMGKTSLALDIAAHAAIKKRHTALLFSLEMSRESLIQRLLCSVARVDSQRFRAGFLSAEERRKLVQGLQSIMEAPLFIDDSPALSLPEMHSKIRRVKPALVIADYLQLMQAPKAENRNQEVSALSRGVKLIAKAENLPVVLLSQLSRAVESRTDKRPQLADLRDSGSIEADADVVSALFREEVYHRDREDLRGLAEWIILKQRSGPTGTVNLVFLHAQTKFENRCEDTGDYADD